MPEHPMPAIYVLGCYGWFTLMAYSAITRPWIMQELARTAKLPLGAFMTMIAVACSILWPITITVILAQLLAERGRK